MVRPQPTPRWPRSRPAWRLDRPNITGEPLNTEPRPISPSALARLIAEMASARTTPAARAVRVGIDAPIEEDGDELALAVVQHLEQAATPVKRLRARDFLRQRSLRLEFGRDDSAGYELWYDVPALRREALDHLGPGGDGSWLPRLRDPQTDRSIRTHREKAPPGSIVLLDGRFLLRPGLRPALDLVIHLDVSLAARTRRAPQDDAPLALGAWEHYLTECRPAEKADLVVRFDHPARPAVIESRPSPG